MGESLTSVMVITAHPDDAEFTCGGSVAKWAQEGRKVIYVVCTNGDKGSQDPTMTSEKLAQIREQEQREAARVLGVNEIIFLGYPDGGLEDTSAFRGELVRLIRAYRPELVVTMEPYRRSIIMHRDHRIAGTVALDAVFPYARDRLSYPEHLKEGLMPHKVAEVYLSGSEEPDLWVDISTTLERKIQALLCHQSQVGGRPQEEFAAMIRQRATVQGEKMGLAYAEAFRRIELRR